MRKTYIQKLAARFGYKGLAPFMSLYPPYLGAGIRVAEVEPSLHFIVIELKQTLATANLVGTQFGGSIYSMCDPWFMFLLMARLGDDYVVWDKGAAIRFLKPGRSALRAKFEPPDDRLDEIRKQLDTVGKAEPVFTVDVTDTNGVVVASIEKTLHAHKPSMKAAHR